MNVKGKRSLLLPLFVLLVLLLLLRPGFLTLGNGERVFIFRLPGESTPGGSVGADLTEQLQERHGEDAEYSFRYLGRDFHGVQYMNCMVDSDSGVLRYIAVDDGDLMSEKRAEVLWETAWEKD